MPVFEEIILFLKRLTLFGLRGGFLNCFLECAVEEATSTEIQCVINAANSAPASEVRDRVNLRQHGLKYLSHSRNTQDNKDSRPETDGLGKGKILNYTQMDWTE